MPQSTEDQQRAVLEWMHRDCEGSLMIDGVERTVNPAVVKTLRSFNATVNELTEKLKEAGKK